MTATRSCHGRTLRNRTKVGGRPILLPTTDEPASGLPRMRRRCARCSAFPLQDAALVRTLCDKGRMQELARANGVPTAQLVVPRSKDDVARFMETAVFPVVVKETGGGRLRSRAGGSKFIVQTAQRTDRALRQGRGSRGSEPSACRSSFPAKIGCSTATSMQTRDAFLD